MKVYEALNAMSDFYGKLVTIEGIFVMKEDVGYMVSSKDDIEARGKAIYLDVLGLKKILLARVPAFGGGLYSYCNEAVIEGVLVTKAEGAFSSALVEVRQLDVYVCGERMVAIP
ncbi:hypothetical protein [Chromobacterium violaceum]|uniref:hypothetical protein n=1 Tax=Chromobacterium violaceum TaxID=536 RepID=UPI0009F028AC|nr:hypothetical protein [Chromobacterium violaceum]OQS45147.1 hypothetical protein B0T48_20210 [Chromobacterium violaceum]OQS46657.1 hypothetical protein B0T49_19010 [Chromobacterium violaceum]QRO33537.1 hypothetical protein I6K04_01940 [Chromobacterium violaceum]QRQ16659.1 hypothetical protein I6K03_20790 [Chromobacterium violaceum]